MSQRHQFLFGQQLQINPAFQWKRIHGQAILPDTDAQSNLGRRGAR
jgi:hypothetical protein